MNEQPITRAKIDELLQFLPLFENPGRETRPEGLDLEKDPVSGDWIMPVPIYPPKVDEFFVLAGQACWHDPEYLSANTGAMLNSDEAIATATLAQVKSMLLRGVRGERFFDGYWDGLIQSGKLAAILRRLKVLRESLQE